MMLSPRSLQGRLLVLVLSLVMLTWLGTAALTWWDTRAQLDELLDAHLAQAAALLVAQQSPEVEVETHAIDAPTLHPYAPKVAFQIFHEGKLTMRSANAPLQRMLRDTGRFATGFETVELAGASWRVFATYGPESDVQVYVGEAMGSRSAILWAVLRGTLWPIVLALPLLALAVWWAVRRGSAPLRHLEEVLSQRHPQDLYAVRLPDATTEMTPMIASLNDLLARIADLLETERRFTADAAHELRTPISAIRAQAQVALAETDPALRQHALRNTLEASDRATRLVVQLLTLSRLESGDTLVMQPLDLGRVLQRVLAELAPQALTKSQELSLEAQPVCWVQGNDTLMAVLLRNFVDNAIRYSPCDARIQVTLQIDAQDALLTVRDSGPGLHADELRKLGTRFYRVLGNDQSGSGLGWSIATRVTQVHKGHLTAARCELLGGLCVMLRLPLAGEPGN